MRILHVLRAPVGGLFRHVQDLAREQVARGHHVGLITDSLTGGELAVYQLGELAPALDLGLLRVPMRRPPHGTDISALLAVKRRVAELKPDVIHGHGSKGGVYARASRFFPSARKPVRAYTPHGGSLNYQPGSLSHHVFMVVERALSHVTDAFLFESAFVAERYREYCGEPPGFARVIPNGVTPAEFEPVRPAADASDFLYVGEFRAAKGLDTLIDALGLLSRANIRPSVTMVGDGPEKALLAEKAQALGVAAQLAFKAPMNAREAFRLGRIMVVPSRFESLPYVVLEAAAAQVPLIATNVGGMGEIFGPYRNRLIVCNDPAILADSLRGALSESPAKRVEAAETLATFVASHFTVARMVGDILDGYRAALASPINVG